MSVDILALVFSGLAVICSGAAAWSVRRSAVAAASSAATQRAALELEHEKVARSDTPAFSFDACRADGGWLMAWLRGDNLKSSLR